MRVATYSQRTAATHASTIAVLLLVATIILGTTAGQTLLQHFMPGAAGIATLAWFGIYVVAIVGLMFNHGLNWLFWIARYRVLLVVLLIGTALSISWSIDPGTSAARTVHLLGTSMVAIYLGFMIPLVSILNILSVVLGGILLFSIASVFVLPELGIEAYEGSSVWKGITTSKNTLGFWAATGVLLYCSQLGKPLSLSMKFLAVLFALISLVALYFSHSATSLLALIVGGAVALYFFIAIRFQLGFVRMVVMAILFGSVTVLALLNIDTAELVGRSGDLTGRGEVWEQTWRLILQKPLTGYGYGSIWHPNDQTLWIQQSLTDFTWIVYHAHNGFLQLASEIGLPLSCIAMLMVVQQMIEIFYCQYERQQVGVLFVLGFVTAYLVTNYSEARFLVHRELYWVLFLALPISMLRQVSVVMTSDDDTASEPSDDRWPDDPPPDRQTDREDQSFNTDSGTLPPWQTREHAESETKSPQHSTAQLTGATAATQFRSDDLDDVFSNEPQVKTTEYRDATEAFAEFQADPFDKTMVSFAGPDTDELSDSGGYPGESNTPEHHHEFSNGFIHDSTGDFTGDLMDDTNNHSNHDDTWGGSGADDSHDTGQRTDNGTDEGSSGGATDDTVDDTSRQGAPHDDFDVQQPDSIDIDFDDNPNDRGTKDS